MSPAERDAGIGRHVAGRAFHHLPVAGTVQQRRHPQLEIQASGDEQIGAPQLEREARFRSHEVRILARVRDARDRDLRAAQLLRDGRVHGQRRDDAHGYAGARGRIVPADAGDDAQQNCNGSDHVILLIAGARPINRSRACVVPWRT
jgi:hypothetical protein